MEPKLTRPNYGMREELLTDDEIILLVYRVLKASCKPWYERDLQRVVAWVQDARLTSGLAEEVLAGNMTVAGVENGSPKLALTTAGEKRAEQLLRADADKRRDLVAQLEQRVAELEKQLDVSTESALKAHADAAAAEELLQTANARIESLVLDLQKANAELEHQRDLRGPLPGPGSWPAQQQAAHGPTVVTDVTATSDFSTSNEVEKQEVPSKPAPAAEKSKLNARRSGGKLSPEEVVNRTLDGIDPLPAGVENTHNNRAIAAVIRGNAAALRRKPGDEPPSVPRAPVERPVEKPREEPVTEVAGLRLPRVFAKCGWAKQYEQKCLDAGVQVKVITREGTWVVQKAS